MQISNRKISHYLFPLCFIFTLVGYIHTHASGLNNMDTLINNVLIDDSNLKKQQDLFFEEISLKKNDLKINSDGANITNLNSKTAIFTFLGNVEIISEIVIIKCDKAVLEFKENKLKDAKFIGLSSFQQFDDERKLIASGTAEVFEYDHITNILRMETNAWVKNGSNEVSGNLITYNLVKRNIIADSENGSPVKLIIDSSTNN